MAQVITLHDRSDTGLKALFAELDRRRDEDMPIANKAELAAQLDVSKQAVSAWTRVPIERVLEISRLLGLEPYILRPDIYPPPATPSRVRSTGTRRGRTHSSTR